MLFLIGHYLIDQLVYIFNPVRRVLLVGFFQFFQISRNLQHILHQLRQRVKFHLAAKSLYHGDKGRKFACAPADGVDLIRLSQRVIKAEPVLVGIILHPLDGSRADAPPWHVDDPLHRHVVPAVVYGL